MCNSCLVRNFYSYTYLLCSTFLPSYFNTLISTTGMIHLNNYTTIFSCVRLLPPLHHIMYTTGMLQLKTTYLDLSQNSIRYLDNCVFRKQGQLETLSLSENLMQSLESGIFSDCTNLRILYFSANNIAEICRAAFYGLAHLEQ